MKRLFWAMAVSMLTIVSCGGFDNSEAIEACVADETRLPNCFDDEVFDLCVVCHEECGDTCATLDTVCPVRYSCPND